MKVLFISLLAGLIHAWINVGGQSVGEPCQKQDTFLVADVVVNPWPIVKKQNYTVTMTGMFLKTELVDQLTIGVKKDLTWDYTFFVINQNYKVNSTASFKVSMNGPTSSGSYTDQVTLHRPDYTQFSCWQFGYSIPI